MFPIDTEQEARVSKAHQTTLIDRELCGADVLIARWVRPAGYTYRAGQWLRLGLPTDVGEEVRTFTHASAPADDWIEIATRLSDSPFKRTLGAALPGDPATLTGPGGHLALPDDTRTVAFLVGGVGITPARSMLRAAAHDGRRFEDAVVFYGNRDPSCVPYRGELASLADAGVRVVDVFEHAPDKTLAERGFISAQIVQRHLGAGFEGPFVVAGPPKMVEAMVAVLDELGVDPSRRMVEWFGTSRGS
jgi:ferredoxin-NADP reductase